MKHHPKKNPSPVTYLKGLACTIVLTSVVCISLSGCGYNNFQRLDEETKSSWSEVVNQYQRRSDLIPNLVATVKGYAQHEEKVLTEVTEARAKATSINVTPELLSDPEKFAKFQEAQGALQSSLGRLLAVAENYPQLKADSAFRDLQVQLEGTENRITVARGNYIRSVKEYNILVRSFPSVMTATIFGYKLKPVFTVENEAAVAKAPNVQF
jgi:LemA protein